MTTEYIEICNGFLRILSRKSPYWLRAIEAELLNWRRGELLNWRRGETSHLAARLHVAKTRIELKEGTGPQEEVLILGFLGYGDKDSLISKLEAILNGHTGELYLSGTPDEPGMCVRPATWEESTRKEGWNNGVRTKRPFDLDLSGEGYLMPSRGTVECYVGTYWETSEARQADAKCIMARNQAILDQEEPLKLEVIRAGLATVAKSLELMDKRYPKEPGFSLFTARGNLKQALENVRLAQMMLKGES